MGYFKNQIIADQVELGDRLPAPKPAADHVALQGPTLTPDRARSGFRWAGWLLIGMSVGFAIGVAVFA